MGGFRRGDKGKGKGTGSGKGMAANGGGSRSHLKRLQVRRELANVVGNVLSEVGEEAHPRKGKTSGQNAGSTQHLAVRPSRRAERKHKRKEAKLRRSFFFEGGRRQLRSDMLVRVPSSATTARHKLSASILPADVPPAKRKKDQRGRRKRPVDEDEEITSDDNEGTGQEVHNEAQAGNDNGGAGRSGRYRDAPDEKDTHEDERDDRESVTDACVGMDGSISLSLHPAVEECSANSTASYVPPHLRRNSESMCSNKRTDSLAEQQRKLRGIMNRVSEGNIDPSSKEMAVVLGKMLPDVGSTAASDALVSVVLPAAVGDPHISVLVLGCHAAMIVAAHVAYGPAFGATALVQIGESLMNRLAAAEEFDVTECTSVDSTVAKNCTIFLALLFSFGMLPGSTIFDLVRFVLRDGLVSDVRIELCLTILRYAGRSLRADYANDFKEILQVVNAAAHTSRSDPSTSDRKPIRTRVDYLLRELQDLKNNKVSFAVMDRFDMTRHWLMKASILGGKKISDYQLPVPFRFLHDDPPKGWPSVSVLESVRNLKSKGILSNSTFVEDLRATAVSQRLSTELRQNLFVALMGAQDFEHAADRILLVAQTAKAGVDEACLVIFHCAIREKAPNPFYEHVADSLSSKPSPYGKRFVHSFKRAAVQNLSQAHRFGLRAAVCLAELCASLVAMEGVNLPIAILRFMKFDTAGEGGTHGMGGVLGILLRHMMESLLRRLPHHADISKILAPLRRYDDVREGMLLVLDGLVKPRMPNSKTDPVLWAKFREARREVASHAGAAA